jgi:hypothetical protein
MTKFLVTKLVDAYVVYTTEVEADDAEAAHFIARTDIYTGKWERDGVREYGDTIYPLDEVELVE